MKALVLAGGDLQITPRIRALARGDLIVVADSGLRHARALDLQPNVIIGDFDSVAEEDLQAYPELRRLRHPVDKDELDLELAIGHALESGAESVTILGAFGSRFDQSLAALLVSCRLRREGLQLSLHDGVREAYPLAAGDTFEASLPEGTLFSLLAFEDAVVSVSGARFELEWQHLPFGVGRGLANRSAGSPRITVHSGLLAVLVDRTPGV